MVTKRMELWNKYHRKRLRERLLPFLGKKWITDSGLSFTEDVLHACLDAYRREEKSVDPKKYMEKLLSIADNLSEKVKKAGGTENAAKESIKYFISHNNIPSQRHTYNLIDILDTIDDEENRNANCLGKTTLFACLAEMVDHNLFSKLRKVDIPSHTFIRIKEANGDRDIETTAPYSEMEGNSTGIGVEYDIKMCIADILYSFADTNIYEEEILNKILNRFPNHESSLYKKAWIALWRKGNISEAEKYINEALKILPECPYSLELKGDIENRKDSKERAREYYRKALSSMYTVLDNEGDFKIKLLKKRLKVSEELGDEEDAVYCKANLLAFEGKYDEAMSLLGNLTNPSREDIKLFILFNLV